MAIDSVLASVYASAMAGAVSLALAVPLLLPGAAMASPGPESTKPTPVIKDLKSAKKKKKTIARSAEPNLASSLSPSNLLEPVGGAFSSASIWKQNITKASVAKNSSVQAASIAKQVKAYYGVAAFNVWRYNASFYSVPASQPRARVKWDDCQRKGYVPTGLFGPGGQFESVPIPDDAVPAAGTDAALTIYDPSSDQMWDFWLAAKKADGWHACWGGRIDNVSSSLGYFLGGFGSSASGLANIGGAVGVREAQAGQINHALALGVVEEAHWTNFSWPAQRADGNGTAPSDIPLGTRFRLSPSVDVDAMPLHPLAKMIAKAAQKYGFIATDRSGAIAVVTESGQPVAARTGVNPWTALLRGTPDYLVMRNFPWDKLEALPRDYGKPANAPR